MTKPHVPFHLRSLSVVSIMWCLYDHMTYNMCFLMLLQVYSILNHGSIIYGVCCEFQMQATNSMFISPYSLSRFRNIMFLWSVQAAMYNALAWTNSMKWSQQISPNAPTFESTWKRLFLFGYLCDMTCFQFRSCFHTLFHLSLLLLLLLFCLPSPPPACHRGSQCRGESDREHVPRLQPLGPGQFLFLRGDCDLNNR